MRAIREQPRLAIARVVLALCLIAVGVVVGGAVRGDDRGAADAAQTRLAAARARLTALQRSADEQRIALERVNARLTRSIAARRRAVRDLRAERRSNDRLRRQLIAARVALRQRRP